MFDSNRFAFIYESLSGTGGFRPTVSLDNKGKAQDVIGASHLVRYPSETAPRYARRNEVAWYTNDMRKTCSRYAAYLARRPATRSINQPLLSAMAQDCDGIGSEINDFWQTFMVDAKARGTMLLLVDMPAVVPDRQSQQTEQRAFPYLAAIAPERILKYSVNDAGAFDSLEISANWNGKAAVRGWNTAKWWVRVGADIVEQGEHPLRACPVLIFSEESIGGEGEFAQIADLSRRLFNLRSELDEILRSQTFSVLAFPLPEEVMMAFAETSAKIAETIGTQNMLMHAPGGQPAFIAPPDGPAKVYGEVIAKMESLIRDSGLDVELPQGVESGLAMNLRFEALNSSLARFSKRMEQLERRVWELASRWLGIRNTVTAEWNTHFALTDDTEELNELIQMQAAAMPDEVIRAKQKALVSAMFGHMPDEELAALLDSIDEPAQEHPSPQPSPDGEGALNEG